MWFDFSELFNGTKIQMSERNNKGLV
jgi:hypothetical protein